MAWWSGVGAGQMSRVDSVHMAVRKAGERSEARVLASDAFFPFRDNIDEAAAGRDHRRRPTRRLHARSGFRRRVQRTRPGDGVDRRAAFSALTGATGYNRVFANENAHLLGCIDSKLMPHRYRAIRSEANSASVHRRSHHRRRHRRLAGGPRIPPAWTSSSSPRTTSSRATATMPRAASPAFCRRKIASRTTSRTR